MPTSTTPPHSPHLFNSNNLEQYATSVTAGLDAVVDRVSRVTKPFSGTTVDQLRKQVDDVDLDVPLDDTAAALTEVDRLYLDDAVYFHDPKYVAHLNCPVVVPALLGEVILSAVNSSLDTWDQSIGATLIERKLIEWTAGRIGFDEGADGVFTSGGTQSNVQAMLMARGRLHAQLSRVASPRTVRLPDLLGSLRILTSDVSHFSIKKAAELLGLGYDAVVTVPTDSERRMDPVALARALDQCEQEGTIPMAVVATAGTTDFGSIDPLAEIARICRTAGVWMHVDAAYGGGLLASTRRRDLLDGIESADSVTVDYHKTFFQPVSSSAVLVRDPDSLGHVAYHADYLNPKVREAVAVPNQVDKSLQTTRRFDALKLWLTLRVMGADAVGEMFDTCIDLAHEAWQMLEASDDIEVVVEPALSTLVFRFRPPAIDDPRALDEINLRIRRALFASGEAVVAGTKVDGRDFLKFTLLNPETTLSHLREIIDLVSTIGRDVAVDVLPLGQRRAG